MTPAASRRTTTAAALVAMVLCVLAPALVAPAPLGARTTGPVDQDLREQAELADAQLADARVRLAEARRRLDAAEQAESAALGALGAIEQRLATARERARVAEQEAIALASALATSHEALADGRDERERRRADLAEHMVWVWKHGPAADVAMRLRIGAGASSPHDVVLGQRVVDRVVRDDTADLGDAEARLAADIAARNPGADLRDLARRAAFEAGEEAAAVDALRRRQLAVLADVANIRRQREAVFVALQADRDALTVLAADLRRLVAGVSLAGALVPPADLDLDGPPPPWADRLPGSGRGWAVGTNAVAVHNGIDGALFSALVWSESGFRADAVSHAGAVGLAQLMPATARGLGVDPYDPWQNLDGGSRYLRTQLEAFGRVDLALAAYNAGPGRVRGAGNEVPAIAETQVYVVRVLERWALLRDAA